MRSTAPLLLPLALITALLAVPYKGHGSVLTPLDATPVRGSHAPGLHTRLLRGQDRLWLELRVGQKGPAWVTLSDPSGRVVLREQVADQRTCMRPVPKESMAGSYTLRIEQEGVTVLRKLVIEQA